MAEWPVVDLTKAPEMPTSAEPPTHERYVEAAHVRTTAEYVTTRVEVLAIDDEPQLRAWAISHAAQRLSFALREEEAAKVFTLAEQIVAYVRDGTVPE